MPDAPDSVHPSLAPVSCWRLVPGNRAKWQSGLLTHDPDLDGWSWEDMEADDAPQDAVRAYWTPPVLDAHTHMGDAFLRPARDNLPRSIPALVAPPHGIKHKELARVEADHVHRAIRERAKLMTRNGTTTALDFREGGFDGLKMLLSAVTDTGLDLQPLARPASDPGDTATWSEEANQLLKGPTMGLGLSGINDLSKELLEEAAEACRRRAKPLALHLAEPRHEPVEEALRYDPRVLVHLVHTERAEWDQLADARVLAVTCPTSNRFFGLKTPLDEFHRAFREQELSTAIGTDNAMLGDGDLRDEARMISERLPEGDLDWLLRSMTWTPWRFFDLGPDPAHPGLLWGLNNKTPNAHPEDTLLSLARGLWESPPRTAPRIGSSS